MSATIEATSRGAGRLTLLVAGVVLLIAAGLAAPAGAQPTRDEQHAREQAAKRAAVAAPSKNIAERTVERLREYGLLGDDPVGFHPVMTRVFTGGGVAFGGGYQNPFGDTGAFTTTAALSIKNYKLVESSVQLPRLAAGRLAIDAGVRWIDAPSVAYYGLGNDSSRDAATTFEYQPTTVGVAMALKAHRTIALGGGLDYLSINTTVAGSGLFPDTNPSSERALVGAPPGLDTDPTYVRARAFAELDWRSRPGFTGSGGKYRVDVDLYSDISDSNLSFRRFETELVQLVPVVRANWVIALRGLTTITQTSGDDDVPYYLMPTLGGGDLRGFSTMRFRGPQRVLLTGELRWTPARFMDMAVFYDTGKVADRVRDLNLDHLHTSYGIGARFHGRGGTLMRWELAHSREHAMRFIWSFGGGF